MNHISTRTYSNLGKSSKELYQLYSRIERTKHVNPHPGLIISTHYFKEEYPIVIECHLLCLAIMDLLILFGYPYPYAKGSYSKFVIIYTIIDPHHVEEKTFTLGTAIPLTDVNNNLIPVNDIYRYIMNQVIKRAEDYEDTEVLVLSVGIRIFIESKPCEKLVPLCIEDRVNILSRILYSPKNLSIDNGDITLPPLRRIRNKKRQYPIYIKSLKPTRTKPREFIVADIETLLYKSENDEDETQYPYSAGFLVVRPGEQPNKSGIEIFFSEDYKVFLNEFQHRSTKVLSDMIRRIDKVSKSEKVKTIYLHNLARFDGILLFRHLELYHKEYSYKALMRDNTLYEIAVYTAQSQNRKLLFRFRDSMHLLPGSLASLANNLCKELGIKGDIAHDKVEVSNLQTNRPEYVKYLKQDILLLGGIMRKAQDIYFHKFNVDIESKITVSSLALSIFRMLYYDDSRNPIYIPNRNEDSFIRRGYYGGHVDTYIPYGKDLFYYDIVSLYPYIMTKSPFPGGKPVWHRDLSKMRLENMFGFIKAFVICPSGMKRPFLPYRKDGGTLIFPTGKFVDVYFTEELKYATSLGYLVYPISGYLFEKMESPFKAYVFSMSESRNEAKAEGHDALAYVYKILMNSLYGRFGINPQCTMTEICDEIRLQYLTRLDGFIDYNKLDENVFIAKYKINIDGKPSEHWQPPSNSAIQISAAITAYARICMYPYVSRPDCYYTDTDSVVLGNPLPDDKISSVLGKFKLEHEIAEGYFLAPKAYYMKTKDEKFVIKYKGAGKNLVTAKWFELQLINPSLTSTMYYTNRFKIDWKKLKVVKKDTQVRLGLQLTSKRIPIFRNKKWVDTKPIKVGEDMISSVGLTGSVIIKQLLEQNTEETLNQFYDSTMLDHDELKTNTSVETSKCHEQDPKSDLVHDTKIDSIPTGRNGGRKKNRGNLNKKPKQKPP